MIWMFAADGTANNPTAKMYPAVVCEVCDEPIHEKGLAAWRVPEVTEDWPRRWQVIFLHKGRCDRIAEAKLGFLHTDELDATLAQMTHNFEHPFTGHDLAEWKRAQATVKRPALPEASA